MIKKILSLLWNGASKNQYYLELGSLLLKKGAGFEIGQIIGEKKLVHQQKDIYKVKVIKSLTYDFGDNKIYHTLTDKIIKPSDKYTKN
ncbi:MAG: hypothetical protein ACPG6B_01330 [Oceanihabitans sp.]